jgi:hypothetical protein
MRTSKQPTRPLPTGLSGSSEYVQQSAVSRADQSTTGGARGSLYSDPLGNTVRRSAIPQTFDLTGPRTRTSPLGQPKSSGQ